MTVVHFLPFWSNTINLSSLRAGELQGAVQDKAASTMIRTVRSSSVMLTMETEASALQYSGKVYHLCLNQVVGRLSSDCTLSAVRGKWDGSSSMDLPQAASGAGSLCCSYSVLRFLAALFGSKVSTSRKRVTISTMALGALPRSLSSSRLFHSSTVAIG